MYINDTNKETTKVITTDEREQGGLQSNIMYLVYVHEDTKEYFERLAITLSEYILCRNNIDLEDNHLVGVEVVLNVTGDLYLFYVAWLGICIQHNDIENTKQCLNHLKTLKKNVIVYSDDYKFYRAIAEFDKFLPTKAFGYY